MYQTVVRRVLIEDIAAFAKTGIHAYSLVLHCATPKSRRFRIAMMVSRGARFDSALYRNFLITKKMLDLYGLNVDESLNDKVNFIGLLGNFYWLKLKVGGKRPDGTRVIIVKDARRSNPFDVPSSDAPTAEELWALIEEARA